jgi:hypothetical protein
MPHIPAEWVKENLHKLTAHTVLMFQGDYDAAFFMPFALDKYKLPWNQVDYKI